MAKLSIIKTARRIEEANGLISQALDILNGLSMDIEEAIDAGQPYLYDLGEGLENAIHELQGSEYLLEDIRPTVYSGGQS